MRDGRCSERRVEVEVEVEGGAGTDLHFTVIERVRDVFAPAVVHHAKQRAALPAVHQRKAGGSSRQLKRHVYSPFTHNLKGGEGGGGGRVVNEENK